MSAPLRAFLPVMLLVACTAEPDEPTATGTGGSTEASSTTGTTAATTTGATTTGFADGCTRHAEGGWNQCKMGNVVNNNLCEWTEGSGAGTVLCLTPTSGAFNVCGIRECVDVCDCFAPPSTGTAVPVCAPILGGGKTNACALYCANGQTCPDGMSCQSGYCYWPN